ncbi:MAG: alpha/beta hydrolase [Acidobacteriota bacterium]|nr:alpha/beta hydrolase [Acidobacteriota bacterium]MDH3522748.1 alpha/beta hydrolase [Acidobacteriota bacterium]
MTKMVLVSLLILIFGTADSVWIQESCRRISIDGRGINACVSGEGPVTVVLAAGAGQSSRTWDGLVVELSMTARVITFDRPGFGQSDPGVEPRTPTRIARELRSLLEALGVEGSVVLVGHSMGGLHVLRYASLFPDRVVGVVILDTPPAGFEEARRVLLTSEERVVRERLLEEGSSRGPAAVRQEREGAGGTTEWDFSTFPREVPLTVLAADSQNFGDLGSAPAHRELWISKSRQWVELSGDAEFLVAEGSGHMIHHDRRDLAIEAIQRLLQRGR